MTTPVEKRYRIIQSSLPLLSPLRQLRLLPLPPMPPIPLLCLLFLLRLLRADLIGVRQQRQALLMNHVPAR